MLASICTCRAGITTSTRSLIRAYSSLVTTFTSPNLTHRDLNRTFASSVASDESNSSDFGAKLGALCDVSTNPYALDAHSKGEVSFDDAVAMARKIIPHITM